MATKNIVPRANGEGAIGDNTQGSEKYWNAGYFLNLNGTDAVEMAKFNADLQWKANTIQAKGDIVFTSGLKAGLYLECTTNGTTGATKFTIPASVVPDSTTIADNTVIWTVRKIGSGSGGGAGIEIGDVTNASITAGHARVMLMWTDPENLVIEGATLAKWAGTLVVRKEGSAPTNKNDGTLVIDSTSKNAYASTPFVDNGLTDGVTYYYRFFPYTTGSTYTTGTVLDATPDRTAVPIPTTDSAFTYDGTYQTPVFTNYDSTKMTKSGDEGATNAGDYATVFTLDEDYKWSDNTIAPKSVNWSIAKAAGSITLSKNSVSLDATTTSDTVTVTRLGDGAISVESSDTSVVTVSLSGDTITVTEVDEGSATITVSVAEGTNYLATSQIISATVQFIPALNDATWEQISQVAQAGEGDLYWDIGDKKEIVLNGQIGGYLTLNNFSTYVFILDFNHPINKTTAMSNIIFGGFKTSDNIDIALCDSGYSSPHSSGKYFNLNHVGGSSSPYNTNYGGWKGCDFRYDILGAVETPPSPYDAAKTTNTTGSNATISAIISPVSNTLMAALPSDFRSALRLWDRYIDAKGNSSNTDSNIQKTVDAITLLAEFEIFGARTYANQYEQNHQQQMTYYKNGNSKIKYKHSDTSFTVIYWWESSAYYGNANHFCVVHPDGTAADNRSRNSYGVAPAFLV